MMNMQDLFLSFLLVCVTAVWGSTFVVVQDAVEQYPVIPFLAIRFLIATVTLAVFTRPRTKVALNSFLVGIGIGITLTGGYLLQTLGLLYTTPTNSGLITGLCIVFVPVIDFLLFRLRPSFVNFGALGVSTLGMLLLVGFSPTGFQFGDVLTLGCAICFGLHISLLSRHAKNHRALVLALGQMFIAGVLFSLLWPIKPAQFLPNQEVWQAILLTGIVASAIGFSVQSYVQQRLSSIRTAVILTTEPVFAAIFGYFLAGDRLAMIQMLGGFLIVSAMLASELYPLLLSKKKL